MNVTGASLEFKGFVILVLVLFSGCALGKETQRPQSQTLVDEAFESDLSAWRLVNADSIEIIPDPGASNNHVLRLTPEKHEYTYAIHEACEDCNQLRIEGRFLFPTEGDGYLGFIYNYQERDGRKDFGCIYVKSNGNYIRMSPHYDGNPSWRLYEEFKVELSGARRIEVARWNQFRLDVVGHRAYLFLADMETPISIFDWFQDNGAFGIEARPGGGVPVWVDDLKVIRLDERLEPIPASRLEWPSDELLIKWEIQGPFDEADSRPDMVGIQHLNEVDWHDKSTDKRGAVIAATDVDTNASPLSIVYLRTKISSPSAVARQLALSTANKLHVWVNGEHIAEVEAEDYIWSDFLSNLDHAGARLKIELRSGENEIVIRLDGKRFAGGGFFAALISNG